MPKRKADNDDADFIWKLKFLQRQGFTFTEIADREGVDRKLVIKLLYPTASWPRWLSTQRKRKW